eukprot:3880476-Prymnesium_polylepis.1
MRRANYALHCARVATARAAEPSPLGNACGLMPAPVSAARPRAAAAAGVVFYPLVVESRPPARGRGTGFGVRLVLIWLDVVEF